MLWKYYPKSTLATSADVGKWNKSRTCGEALTHRSPSCWALGVLRGTEVVHGNLSHFSTVPSSPGDAVCPQCSKCTGLAQPSSSGAKTMAKRSIWFQCWSTLLACLLSYCRWHPSIYACVFLLLAQTLFQVNMEYDFHMPLFLLTAIFIFTAVHGYLYVLCTYEIKNCWPKWFKSRAHIHVSWMQGWPCAQLLWRFSFDLIKHK